MFPPIEAYAVNFAGGNLHPHVNPYGWPAVRISQQTYGAAIASPDSKGYRLYCTADGISERTLSLYLVLPQPRPDVFGPPALPADVRAFIRVTFDLPHASGPNGTDFTRPWAVSANLRIDRDIDRRGAQQLNVTSQFAKTDVEGVTIKGVRLNTPGSLQQEDKALRLDGPLVYSRYRPWWGFPGAIFTLDHAFCGYAVRTTGHTPGSGTLRIRWPFGTTKLDHRVYSSETLRPLSDDTPPVRMPLPAGTTIGAVGVSVLAGDEAGGDFSARVRSFRLWLDRALGSPARQSPADNGP